MAAILPVYRLSCEQAQVEFVDERGRLQRVIGAFAAQALDGNAAQLLVNQHQQLALSRLIARAHAPQHGSQLRRLGERHLQLL